MGRRPYYEMHVRGFTRIKLTASARVSRHYAGLIEKDSYLQQTESAAVNCCQWFQFDAQDCHPARSTIGATRQSPFRSAQGISPGRIRSARSTNSETGQGTPPPGIEVILDVGFKFNTAEGDRRIRGLFFRGIETKRTTWLGRRRSVRQLPGCGKHGSMPPSIVRSDDSQLCDGWKGRSRVPLRPGFHLSRDATAIRCRSRVLWDMRSDPALAGPKLIAESGGCRGLYQVGRLGRLTRAGMERPYREMFENLSSVSPAPSVA